MFYARFMAIETTAGRQQTAAARAARTRAKHERWAREMWAHGWFCHRIEGDDSRKDATAGMNVYAINHTREVYRVVGWQMDGRPELLGDGEIFIGDNPSHYLFAIGR